MPMWIVHGISESMHFHFARYINEDTSIVPMLKMLRDSGRSTFLVTNRYFSVLCFADNYNLQFYAVCALTTMLIT